MDHRGSPCSGLTVQVYSVYYVLPKSVWGAAEYQTGRHPGSPVMPILVIIDQKDWDSVIHFRCQRRFWCCSLFPPRTVTGLLVNSPEITPAHGCPLWLEECGFGCYSSPWRPRVCVTTAAVPRGDGGLITDCSVFLPAPLGETHTVNWMRTRGGGGGESQLRMRLTFTSWKQHSISKGVFNFLFPSNVVDSQQAYLIICYSPQKICSMKWKGYCTIHSLIIYLFTLKAG